MKKRPPSAYMRKFNLKKNYGLSLEEYDAMYAYQKGCCAICNLPEAEAPRKRLCVDHCHKSGKIRGLLCGNCNTGIGMLRDNSATLQAAITYLRFSRFECDESIVQEYLSSKHLKDADWLSTRISQE